MLKKIKQILGKNKSCLISISIFMAIYSFCSKVLTPDILKAKEYFEFQDYKNCLKDLDRFLMENETNVEAHRLYQDVKMELDEFPSLLKEYEMKLNKAPKNYLYNYLYGRLLFNFTSIDNRSKYFIISKELNPHFPWNYDALAKVSIVKNDYLKAINLSEECIKICGDFIPSYLTMVDCYKNLYKPDVTIALLEKLINKFPSEIEFILEFAKLYIAINENTNAENVIIRYLDNYKNDYKFHQLIFEWVNCTDSRKNKKKLLDLYWNKYPDSKLIVSVYNNLFDMFKSESIEKALAFSREAIKYKTKVKKLKSVSYENLIEYYKRKNDYANLIQIGKEILSSNFDNPNIINTLGELFLNKENIDLAILLFDKSRDSCKWENLKNNVYFGTLRNDKDKNKIINLYLNTSNYYLGKANYLKEEYLNAIDYFDNSLEEDERLNEKALIYKAKCYLSLNNKNEALKILNHAYVQLGSKNAFDLLNIMNINKLEKTISLPKNNKNNFFKYESLSKYKGMIIMLGMFSSSCEPCLKVLAVINRLKNKYLDRKDIVIINLFEENDSKLVLESMIVDKPLFKKIQEEFNIWKVPQIFIVDKDGSLLYTIVGYDRDEDNYEHIKFKIDLAIKGIIEYDR